MSENEIARSLVNAITIAEVTGVSRLVLDDILDALSGETDVVIAGLVDRLIIRFPEKKRELVILELAVSAIIGDIIQIEQFEKARRIIAAVQAMRNR